MSVLNVTENNFEQEVLKSNKKVIVDFYADWCGPCKMMSPIIDEIAEEQGDNVKVVKVNLDENINLAEKYEVMSIPTIMVFNNGQIIKTFIGVTAKEQIIESLN